MNKPPRERGHRRLPSLAVVAVGGGGAALVFLALLEFFARLSTDEWWPWNDKSFAIGADVPRNATAAAAAVAVAVAGAIAYTRQRTDEDNHRLEEAKADRDAARDERAQIEALRSRYTDAAAQLGHESSAIRLAGVYAMAALADDWIRRSEPYEAQTCINVLCGYVRASANPIDLANDGRSDDPTEPVVDRGEVEVRQTITAVITARLQSEHATDWHGRDFDFSGAQFSCGTYSFAGARFTGGRLSFIGAVLSGGSMSFNGALFSGGDASFSGALFSGGDVSFHDATFSGGDVSFDGATFSGGDVSFDWAEFASSDVSFGGATFSGGDVSFGGATFSGGHVSFQAATFSGANVSFAHAEFAGGRLYLGDADFLAGRVLFFRAKFVANSVSLDGANFAGAFVSFDVTDFVGGSVTFDGALVDPAAAPRGPWGDGSEAPPDAWPRPN